MLQHAQSALGIAVILALAWAFSENRRAFPVRTVLSGLALQVALALLLLKIPAARNVLFSLNGVVDALTLIATLVAWNYLLNYLAFHFAAFRWLSDPPPICLIRNGRLVRSAMRSEHLTDAEVMAKLRDAGIERVSDARAMYLESDGSFSVLKRRH